MVLGEFLHGGLDAAGAVGEQKVALHVGVEGGTFGLFELEGVAVASAGRAQVVDGAIAGDGEQPGSYGALLGVEAVDAIPDAQERLLYEVFGDPGVAVDAEDERNDDATGAI